MKILILGATGRTGKILLEEALKANYTVHVLVRDKANVMNKSVHLTLFEGTPSNKQSLSNAMKGCNAVISVLNISRASDFPWAKLRTPENFLSEVMQNVISLAAEQNVRRVIVCSAWGVHETKADLPGWFRWFINNSNLAISYKGHEHQEVLIKASDLDWTIVRPVGLTNSKKEGEVQISFLNSPQPKITISRLDVAKFMIRALTEKAFIRQTPAISNK